MTDHATAALRVGVVGAGLMGADHITRITDAAAGARVSAIVEPDAERARTAARLAPDADVFAKIEEAIDARAMDAVIVATPGRLHEQVLLPALAAELPILCEKPLADDPSTAWRIAQAEQQTGRRLIQVGFMRRFDPDYLRLRELIAGGTLGELVMIRGVHRNPSVPPSYTQEMLITDTLVHELDAIPWLADSAVKTVTVRYARSNRLDQDHVREPILVLLELDNGVLADVELNVSIRFGYQVTTEAVFERGVARIGQPTGPQLWHDGRCEIAEHQSFKTRFRLAYDAEVQGWIDAVARGETVGCSTWDGYAVALSSEAGVRALHTDGPVEVDRSKRTV